MSLHKAYITASSLWCHFGNDSQALGDTLRTLTPLAYETYVKEHLAEKPYYHFHENFASEEEKLYTTLDTLIQQVINQTGLSEEECREVAIFIGSTAMGISLNEAHYAHFLEHTKTTSFNHLGYGYLGTYLEKRLGSKHKALLFSTACTSSVNALAYASKMIERGVIQKALVVGIELFNRTTYNGFSSLMLLSKNNLYRPFDERSDGIILGESCSALLLENQPRTAHDFYYKGSKNQCDIYSETTSNPSGEPIFETMDGALDNAKLDLHAIDIIKAHATGSENNNISEANALHLLFEKYAIQKPITALKPLLGHTLGASGSNEIALSLLCAKEGFIPPAYGFEIPAEGVMFEPLRTPFTCKDKPLSILFNFVAFGGNTTSLILARD